MSRTLNNDEEKEAGTPYMDKEETPKWQGLIPIEDDSEPEAGRPYYVAPKPDEQPAPASTDPKPFNVKEEFDKLQAYLRKPNSYEANIAEAKSDKKFRESVAALSLLLNTAKGAFGGNVRLEDYSGIGKAASEVNTYEAMAAKDTDRYEDDKNKLWMNLYNLGLKDKAADRTNKLRLEQVLAKEASDARNIDRRNDATKEQIGLRGDVTIGVEGVKQDGRKTLGKQKFGQQMSLEAFKQQGRERLKLMGEQLKQAGQLSKPFIDIASPYGQGSVGLTKGESLEFFNWLLDKGDATQEDFTLMMESLTGTAANNVVQSKVVSYAQKNPEKIKGILSNRGKSPTSQVKGNPLQSRSSSTKGNPLEKR